MEYFINSLALRSKILYFLLTSVFFIPAIQAQQTVNTSGGNATGTGGNSSYSVGQVVYTNTTGSGGSINQGVQQPFEIMTLGIDNFPEIVLQMAVYPNPTSSYVNLKIDVSTALNIQSMSYLLFDINGRELSNQKINSQETQIGMENLPAAIYFLKIVDEGKLLKTFKIIKNN